MTGRPHPHDFEQAQWVHQAACKGRDQKFWIGTTDANQTKTNWSTGRRICRILCPVQTECLEHAINNDERHDLWGGHTPAERHNIIRRERNTKRR